MARKKVDDLEQIALWSKTAKRLRLIARLTGKSMIQVADHAILQMAGDLEPQLTAFQTASEQAKAGQFAQLIGGLDNGRSN